MDPQNHNSVNCNNNNNTNNNNNNNNNNNSNTLKIEPRNGQIYVGCPICSQFEPLANQAMYNHFYYCSIEFYKTIAAKDLLPVPFRDYVEVKNQLIEKVKENNHLQEMNNQLKAKYNDLKSKLLKRNLDVETYFSSKEEIPSSNLDNNGDDSSIDKIRCTSNNSKNTDATDKNKSNVNIISIAMGGTIGGVSIGGVNIGGSIGGVSAGGSIGGVSTGGSIGGVSTGGSIGGVSTGGSIGIPPDKSVSNDSVISADDNNYCFFASNLEYTNTLGIRVNTKIPPASPLCVKSPRAVKNALKIQIGYKDYSILLCKQHHLSERLCKKIIKNWLAGVGYVDEKKKNVENSKNIKCYG
ncbi:hypothetical protein ACTFIV_009344 [Dictyostelium citrinum]